MREHSSSSSRALRPLWLAPLGAVVMLAGMVLAASPAEAQSDGATAQADLCAQVAAHAGFPRQDRLVTAVAVGLAESGCNPAARSANGATRGCPNGSVDVGLWQINNCHHREVSAQCARHPQCNANAAYRISAHGQNFRPWVTYQNGRYRAYLGQARAAVNRLGRS